MDNKPCGEIFVWQSFCQEIKTYISRVKFKWSHPTENDGIKYYKTFNILLNKPK